MCNIRSLWSRVKYNVTYNCSFKARGIDVLLEKASAPDLGFEMTK